MAKYSIGDTSLSAIVDIPREKLGMGEQKVPFSEIPSLITQSLSKASQEGYDGGYSAGEEAGRKSEYNEFWDGFQNNGKRTDYRHTFANNSFVHINPKYVVKSDNSDSMMVNSSNIETVNWEKFDLSNTSSLYNAFGFCRKLKEVNTDLGLSKSGANTAFNSIFRQCGDLTTVKKITAIPSAVWKDSFELCNNLTSIIFDGEIGSNGLDLHWSTKLDRDSIVSIINALSTTTSGRTVTLSEAAVNNAFETSKGVADGSSSTEWLALAGTKTNWTISLV
jgi:hypothetical protein